MVYTSVGGVYVSIVTDQWQAKFSLFLSAISVLYMLYSFRPAEALPDLPDYLALNENGIGSIITLGLSFPAVSMFNDAYWQRVWSSEDEKALKKGAFAAFFMISFVIFIFGFGGFLASWAGYVSDPNFAFFELIAHSTGDLQEIMLIVVTMLAVAMNESLVDSFQNALTDCSSSLALSLGFEISITAARIITIFINIPIVIIGLQGYDVNSIFLISCLLTTTSFLPVVLGIYPGFDKYIHQSTALFSCLFSICSIMIYGWIVKGSLLQGLYYCFWQTYRWQVFLTAFTASAFGIALFLSFEFFYRYISKTAWKSFTPHGDLEVEYLDAFIHDEKIIK
jgi:SSS family solute:Na+ symporter